MAQSTINFETNPLQYTNIPALIKIKVLDTNDMPPIFKQSTSKFYLQIPALKGDFFVNNIYF